MSVSLSVASVIDSNSLSSGTPWLVLIDLEIVNPVNNVVETVKHFARNPEDVTFNGTVYEKGAFDLQISQISGQVAEVSLSIKDHTRVIQSLMEEYGGGVGSNITLYVVNAARLDHAPEIVEFFQITGSSASEYSQSFQLGAENALAQTFPRRRQTRDFCQWRYKDSTTCRYAGALTGCDLTLQGPNGCEAHGNSLNFGAYPGLNSNGYRYS
jgi:phage-related protein